MSDSEQVAAGKRIREKISGVMDMIGDGAGDPATRGAIRASITSLATESYSAGLKDATEDLEKVGASPAMRQSIELATTSVKAMEDIAAAVVRIAEALEERGR